MIFIDGSNLYHVLMRNCGRYDLYFSKFATKLANKRKIERIFYYNVRQELEGKITIPEQQKKFLSTLNRIPNIEVKLGIWKEQNGSIVEKGVDVLLATDLVLNAAKNKFDTAIIVSGDGDFFPAIESVQAEGKRVEVAAFQSNISKETNKACDKLIKLHKFYFNNLWIPKRNRNRYKNTPKNTPNNDKLSSYKTQRKRRKISI